MGATVAPMAPGESRAAAGSLVELTAGAHLTAGPDWLVALRRAGAERFAEVGIPTSKHEEWRFTPVGPIGTIDWGAPQESGAVRPSDIAPYTFGDGSWPLLVLVDGVFDEELSSLLRMPGGASFGSLAQAIADGVPAVEAHLGQHATTDITPFGALNAALVTDGAYLHVPRGVVLDVPVQVLHVVTTGSRNAVVAPRVLAVLEDGARASIVESFVTLADMTYFTNTCSEAVVGQNAWLEHVRVQREGSKGWHIGLSRVDQDRDSHYRSFTLNMGGKLARHDLHAKLNAPGIETLLYGLYLTRGEQLVDNHTTIFHDHPNCNSWEVYKGVLAEHSRAVFNGKVLVQPEAQKTDAKQTNRNLLLSDDARVNTKPQLEIFADDVKCTHGATIGKLDEHQRYYMATRGIGGNTAQALLIWAFAAEVLAEVSVTSVREALEAVVHRQLDALIS